MLSFEMTALEDSPLIDHQLTAVELSAAGKLLHYVHQTQLRELSHLQALVHYDIKDYLQMSYATKSSLDLLENARTGKSMGAFIGCLMKPKQPWVCVY